MATAAKVAPPRATRSFAGLLEEYAAPKRKVPPKRDLDGLEDDVATLSYERALKTHVRYRPAPELDPNPNSLAIAAQPALREEPQALPRAFVLAHPAQATRKSASVTVRMTAEENDRLRARAAEAGLTVSTYLRSCTLDVESLRAQVKEEVARMRAVEERAPGPIRSWLRRLFSRLRKHG
jgi:hypothetical protein